MKIIAHRGASGEAPENTLAAIRLAFEQSADGVEIDVRLTADGEVVAIHDADTSRVAGKRLKIAETPYAELSRLDIGSWKDEAFAGERIPLLSNVLEILPSDKSLYIEIKSGKEILPELARILKEAGGDRMVVIGYGFEVLSELKKLLPDVVMLQVLRLSPNPKTRQETSIDLSEWIGPIVEASLNGFDLGVTEWLTAESVQNLKDHNLQLAAWTINDSAEAHRLQNMGLDAITTDFPGMIRDQLSAPEHGVV